MQNIDTTASTSTQSEILAHVDQSVIDQANAHAQAATIAAQAKRAKRDANKQASAAKPTAKPVKASKQSGKQSPAKLASPKAAKPVDAAADKARAQRAAITDAERVRAAIFYNGASLPVHASRPLPFGAYADRVRVPVQRANSESVRDASFLAIVLSRADKTGAFDPCAGSGLDAGCVSRASSLGYLTVSGDKLKLTDRGLARARAIVRKAA